MSKNFQNYTKNVNPQVQGAQKKTSRMNTEIHTKTYYSQTSGRKRENPKNIKRKTTQQQNG